MPTCHILTVFATFLLSELPLAFDENEAAREQISSRKSIKHLASISAILFLKKKIINRTRSK